MLAVELEGTDGQLLPRPEPGQYVTLRLDSGSSTAPVVRSYSLSGPPTGGSYRLGIKLEAEGAAGRILRDRVGVGDEVEVGAPRGVFTLEDGTNPVVLISAGIGVTPVLAMLHALRDAGSPRDVWWFHGARNRSEQAFAAEVDELLSDLRHTHRVVTYSDPAAADRRGVDYDAIGRLTPAALTAAGAPLDGDFYLCGPTAFMDAMRDGLVALGVSVGHVRTEVFGAQGSIRPGVVAGPSRTPHPPEGAPGDGPLVSFVRTGLDVRWGDGWPSLLELAEACDVPVRWSCRSGVCHTCETGLLEGSVTYGPDPLDPPAVGNALLCCSRPTSDLVLDL